MPLCTHHWLRRTEGTRPDHLSGMRNRVTPLRSGLRASNPTARKGQFFSGNRMLQEAKASRRKTKGIHNLLDRAHAQPERVLTCNG